eukprot:6419948-Amphidinium_carterae.1
MELLPTAHNTTQFRVGATALCTVQKIVTLCILCAMVPAFVDMFQGPTRTQMGPATKASGRRPAHQSSAKS